MQETVSIRPAWDCGRDSCGLKIFVQINQQNPIWIYTLYSFACILEFSGNMPTDISHKNVVINYPYLDISNAWSFRTLCGIGVIDSVLWGSSKNSFLFRAFNCVCLKWGFSVYVRRTKNNSRWKFNIWILITYIQNWKIVSICLRRYVRLWCENEITDLHQNWHNYSLETGRDFRNAPQICPEF